MASIQLDGDKLKGFSAGDETTEQYSNMLSKLDNLKQNSGMAFLYTLTTDGVNVYYGIDSDVPENRSAIGEPFEVSYEELKPVFDGDEL